MHDVATATTPRPAPAGAGAGWRRNWPVLLIGVATMANGLVGVLLGFIIRINHSPRFYNLPMPYGVYHWSRLLELGFGLLLLYLSFHLLLRRRSAWWLALFSLTVALVGHAIHEHHLHLAPIPAVTIVLLLAYRGRFTVRSEPRNIVQGIALMSGSLLFALAYGTLGFWLLDKRDFGVEFQWGDSLVRTLRAYLLIGNGDLTPYTRRAAWFFDSLGVTGVTAVVFAVYSLFRPLAFRLSTLPHERALAARLLSEHGRCSEHYFALLPDKSYYFNKDGTGFIAYRVAGGVALCLADPVAPDSAVPGLVRDFAAFCDGNGWSVAFLYTLPDLLPVYAERGLRALKIGADAIVDIERFCTETGQSKQFRRNKRRLEEDGFSTARYVPPHPPELVEQFEQVSRAWLSLPGRRERSFALGTFTRDYAEKTPFFAVLDRELRIVAFANETPAYRPGLATIDMMRHRPDLPHGIMDYLFDELLCRLREQGFRQFDLGLAPLAGVGDHPEATAEEKVVRQVFDLLSRYFPFEGLRAYKAKFEPAWEDRFLVYQGGPAGLVKTGFAMSRILA